MTRPVVFLSQAVADSTDEQTDSEKGNETEENCDAQRPTGLTLQLVVIPVHSVITLTFPSDAGEVSSKPGPTDTEVQVVVLTEEISVHPAAVISSPAHHSVPHPPGVPVIELPASVAPQQELPSGFCQLEEGDDSSELNPCEPTW